MSGPGICSNELGNSMNRMIENAHLQCVEQMNSFSQPVASMMPNKLQTADLETRSNYISFIGGAPTVRSGMELATMQNMGLTQSHCTCDRQNNYLHVSGGSGNQLQEATQTMSHDETHTSITSIKRRSSGVSDKSVYAKRFTNTVNFADDIRPIGKSGMTVLADGKLGRRVHIEIPLEYTYELEDLSVHIHTTRITVTGQCFRNQWDRPKSFEAIYTAPGSLDMNTLRKQLRNRLLLVEIALL
ncbi:unnamed protein product [Dicrocoelium dendriticum]|nr:unnamed protein product [Dicrocoelium dendriticum]